MAFTIPEELQAFVSRCVASGRFRSEDEAVQKGLKLLRDCEGKLDALRTDLQVGIDQLDAGQKVPFDVEAIEQRGRELLKAPPPRTALMPNVLNSEQAAEHLAGSAR